ncbi:ribosome small subunit-dependent GTPase A [Candidatus Zixiibacteriota bacterium]
MDLYSLGWDSVLDQLFEKYREVGLSPGRIALEHKQLYTIMCEHGELSGRVTGHLQHETSETADYPTVGDWVAIEPRPAEGNATIHKVLPRRSAFSRKAVLAGGPKYGEGRTEEQILAANVDIIFLVTGLDNNFNLRRLERYLSVVWDGGATPVVVLNKTDVCADIDGRLEATRAIAAGVPVHAISAANDDRVDELREYLPTGKTGAFLGSSGVGKSTIVNCLVGEEILDTGGVRLADSRGRHTTTRRELILLPSGGLVIDTPGLREIQLWGDEKGLNRTFEDIEKLFEQCRFTDCNHNSEPGCAVKQALEDGTLDSNRYQSYLKLQKELRNLNIRKNAKVRRSEARARDKKHQQYHKERKNLQKRGLM